MQLVLEHTHSNKDSAMPLILDLELNEDNQAVISTHGSEDVKLNASPESSTGTVKMQNIMSIIGKALSQKATAIQQEKLKEEKTKEKIVRLDADTQTDVIRQIIIPVETTKAEVGIQSDILTPFEFALAEQKERPAIESFSNTTKDYLGAIQKNDYLKESPRQLLRDSDRKIPIPYLQTPPSHRFNATLDNRRESYSGSASQTFRP